MMTAVRSIQCAEQGLAEERRAQVSNRMVAYWLENMRPLAEFWKRRADGILANDRHNFGSRAKRDPRNRLLSFLRHR